MSEPTQSSQPKEGNTIVSNMISQVISYLGTNVNKIQMDPDCDGLCEWTCKLCKKRDPSDRRRNATMRERRRLKRVNEAYDGLKKCAVR